MIDIKNGNIILNSETIVGSNSDFEAAKNLNIDKTISDFKNGYKWIHFENLKVKELYINLNVCFYHQKTKMITFTVSNNDIKDKSWDNWSQQNEIDKTITFENWLTQIIGEQREYDWGTIATDYDTKGGGTQISITYK